MVDGHFQALVYGKLLHLLCLDQMPMTMFTLIFLLHIILGQIDIIMQEELKLTDKLMAIIEHRMEVVLSLLTLALPFPCPPLA